MPAFAVSAIDRMGNRRSLREAAPDEPALRRRLRSQALWPVRIREMPADRRLARLALPSAEFLALLHQLELQLRAGVTADAALAQLVSDMREGPARTILERIHAEVTCGSAIHVACRTFERQFPPHLVAVIAAGEASARLPEALRALADHVAGAETLRRTARRALIYPAIVLTATAALVVFMLGGVVPQFASIFTSLRIPLPWPTVALLTSSTFVRVHGLHGALALGMAAALALPLRRAPAMCLLRDRALLRVPVLGVILRHLATARLAAHLRLLHEANVPLLDALESGTHVMANLALARDIMHARNGVADGRPLHSALPPDHSLPAFVVPALRSGETSGQLGAALRHIETYAGGIAQERLGIALALLEPALISVLTAIVGFIALSFFLPIFQLLGGIR
jgi:general secretion pathway protein F